MSAGVRMSLLDRMSGDTTAEATAKLTEVLRRVGPAGRAAMTFELSDNLRSIVEAGVRLRHPDWDSRSVRRQVYRVMLGDDLFRQAFGKDRIGP
jgi:hypothetical protein